MGLATRPAAALSLVFLLTGAAVGSAQDAGRFRFVFGGERDYTTIEHPDKTVTAGEIHGLWVVTEGDESGPFVDEAILHGSCAVRVTAAGGESDIAADCALEDEEHDELYLVGTRRSGDVVVGGDGVFTLSGGTGKFDGIGGVCPYTVHYMEDDDLVIFAHCEWTKN